VPVTIPRVRARGILGGIVSLALVAAPGAMAQAPAAQTDADRTTAEAEHNPAADEGRQRGVQAPVRARIKLQLKGIQNGKVDVGERFKAVGTVGPFVPNQEILLLVKRDGQTIKRLTKPVERGGKEGNIGRFDIRSPKVIKPGDYRVRANKLPTPQQQRALRASRGVEVDYPDLDPGDHGKNVKLLNKLLKKKAYYTSNGSSYGSATSRAILAFRKVNNMSRTQTATPGIFQKLAAGKGGFHLKWKSGGKHIEADLSRQVMVLAKNGKAKHIFHISSGAPATPTIRGKFPTYRKDYGTNSLGMIHSVYFIRGYATHGYHSVPTYPASHGCLRNPPANALFIYNWIDMGDVFYVYG
jgi:L,D-transpeptidase catalytic domain